LKNIKVFKSESYPIFVLTIVMGGACRADAKTDILKDKYIWPANSKSALRAGVENRIFV
jgi:hypothetical protein